MSQKRIKLTEDQIKEIARINFREALVDYDFDILTEKINAGKMYTVIEIHPGQEDVDVVVHEAARADSPTSTDYGIITVNPYSGECKRVEILNLRRLDD